MSAKPAISQACNTQGCISEVMYDSNHWWRWQYGAFPNGIWDIRWGGREIATAYTATTQESSVPTQVTVGGYIYYRKDARYDDGDRYYAIQRAPV